MRRTSLTQTQARKLAVVLKRCRSERGFTMRELAAQAKVNKTSVESLERGTNLSPQPETLRGIAEALGLSVTDLMVDLDWLPAGELPALRPYLRAKYGLDDTEVAAVDEYLARLQRRHGTDGPRRGDEPQKPEDEPEA